MGNFIKLPLLGLEIVFGWVCLQYWTQLYYEAGMELFGSNLELFKSDLDLVAIHFEMNLSLDLDRVELKKLDGTPQIRSTK